MTYSHHEDKHRGIPPLYLYGLNKKNDRFMQACFRPALQGDPIMILAKIRNLIILSLDVNMDKKEFSHAAGGGGGGVNWYKNQEEQGCAVCKIEAAIHCVCRNSWM